MTTAFDTLSAAQHMEDAGMDRKHAEAIASAIRSGQGELATKDDLRAATGRLDTRISAVQWTMSIHFAISLATLAAVLAIAFRA